MFRLLIAVVCVRASFTDGICVWLEEPSLENDSIEGFVSNGLFGISKTIRMA